MRIIGKLLFVFFVSIGFVLFFIVAYSLGNHDFIKNYVDECSINILPAFFILLSSLIAAFSVNRTILNTREMKDEEVEKEKNKTQKILEVGKKFLDEELKIQKDFFEQLKNEITTVSMKNLSSLDTVKYFYTDKTNEDKIINQIDYMLKIEIHQYTDKQVLSNLFEIKNNVIIIIHYVSVLKNNFITNNNRDEALNVIDEIIRILDKMEDNLRTIF